MKSDGVYLRGHKLKKENLTWKEYFSAYIFMHKKKFSDDATPYLGYEWSYTKAGAKNIAKNHSKAKLIPRTQLETDAPITAIPFDYQDYTFNGERLTKILKGFSNQVVITMFQQAMLINEQLEGANITCFIATKRRA